MNNKIKKWLERGYIDEETAKLLYKDIAEDRERLRRLRLNITIYTIASIFLGIGIITFIASNDWIIEILKSSNLLKILLMVILTLGSLWGGYELAYENKKFPRLGNALIVLSSLLIGGTYALVGQIYNINANNYTLMFIWLLSILPLAYVFKNRVINVISIIIYILAICYYYSEIAADSYEAWTVFIPIILGTSLYTFGNIPIVLEKFNNFSVKYKIIGTLPVFLIILALTCYPQDSYHLVSVHYIVPIILLILFNIANYVLQKNITLLLKLETSCLNILLCLMLMLCCLPTVNELAIIIISNIILILIMAFGFHYGYKFEHEKIVSTTNWMLLIYAGTNYCRWGWNLLDKAIFFLLGGIVLLSLGLYLEKSRKKIGQEEEV